MSTFFVSGSPVGKQSVRVTRGHSYIPTKTRKYMKQVASAFKLLNVPMIDGAVELNISEYRERPQYHYGTGRNTGMVKGQYREVFCVTKPDTSNTLKGIEDALNGLAWTDDAYIIDTHHHKRYANPGERVGVFVTIEPAVFHSDGIKLKPEHRQEHL